MRTISGLVDMAIIGNGWDVLFHVLNELVLSILRVDMEKCNATPSHRYTGQSP